MKEHGDDKAHRKKRSLMGISPTLTMPSPRAAILEVLPLDQLKGEAAEARENSESLSGEPGAYS